MLDQLYYTSAGKHLGGHSGFGPRAASTGLSDIKGERYRKLLFPLLGYQLPKGMNPYKIEVAEAPIDLAFMDVGTERILLHRRYVGPDGMGRPGNFLNQVLTGLPSNFGAREAISLWRSEFWPEAVSLSAPVTLPQVAVTDLRAGPLNAASLSDPDDPSIVDALVFLITAFLVRTGEQRLFILAAPDTVAVLIWGLTNSLPAFLRDHITFSTYAADLGEKSKGALITGTYWPSARENLREDLPAWCYGDGALSINLFSDRRSDLRDDRDTERARRFASYAVSQLQSNADDLNDLLTAIDSLSVKDIDRFLFISRLFTGSTEEGGITTEDVQDLLDNHKLAVRVLNREIVQEAIITYATRDPKWWREACVRRIKALRKYADQEPILPHNLLSLAGRVLAHAVEAIRRNQLATAELLMEIIELVTDSASIGHLWCRLFEEVNAAQDGDRPVLDWPTRRWLVSNWGRYLPELDVDLIRPWIRTNWQELQELLASSIPLSWQVEALTMRLMDEAPSREISVPDDIFMAYQRDPQLFQKSIVYAIEHEGRLPVLELFDKLVDKPIRGRMQLVEIMIDAAGRDSDFSYHVLMKLGQHLDYDDLHHVVTKSHLFERLFCYPIARQTAVELMIRDDIYSNDRHLAIIGCLLALRSGGSQSVVKLVEEIASTTLQCARKEIANDNLYLARRLVDEIAVQFEPAKAIWQKLSHLLSDVPPEKQRSVSWNLRVWLLTSWHKYAPGVNFGNLKPWLDIPLADLISLPTILPDHWHRQAVVWALSNPELEHANFTRIRENYQATYSSAVSQIISELNKPVVLRLLAILAAHNDSAKLTLLDKVMERWQHDGGFVVEALRTARLETSEVEELLWRRSRGFVGALQIDPSLSGYIDNYLVELSHQLQISWAKGKSNFGNELAALQRITQDLPHVLPRDLIEWARGLIAIYNFPAAINMSSLMQLHNTLKLVPPPHDSTLIGALVIHLVQRGNVLVLDALEDYDYIRQNMPRLFNSMLKMTMNSVDESKNLPQVMPFVELMLLNKLNENQRSVLLNWIKNTPIETLQLLTELTSTWEPEMRREWDSISGQGRRISERPGAAATAKSREDVPVTWSKNHLDKQERSSLINLGTSAGASQSGPPGWDNPPASPRGAAGEKRWFRRR